MAIAHATPKVGGGNPIGGSDYLSACNLSVCTD